MRAVQSNTGRVANPSRLGSAITIAPSPRPVAALDLCQNGQLPGLDLLSCGARSWWNFCHRTLDHDRIIGRQSCHPLTSGPVNGANGGCEFLARPPVSSRASSSSATTVGAARRQQRRAVTAAGADDQDFSRDAPLSTNLHQPGNDHGRQQETAAAQRNIDIGIGIGPRPARKPRAAARASRRSPCHR